MRKAVTTSRQVPSATTSRELYEHARTFLVDGVSGDNQFVKPHPIYIQRGRGAHLYDLDGNEYLDYQVGAGAVILGHAHPAVIGALQEELERGIPNAVPNDKSVRLAHKIQQHVPGLERLRFLPSASEALQAAVKTARAFSRKYRIAKIEGGYHGQFGELLVSVDPVAGRRGPAKRPRSTAHGAGVHPRFLDNVTVLPFNDIDATVDLIERDANDLALVMVEPVLGVAGAIPAEPAYLVALREVTERNDVLLLFDETITGFRLGLSGAQGHYGVAPDLTVLGKIIGGGFPIGAYGGRADVMSVVGKSSSNSSDDHIFQSGTFSGHPFSMAAGLAVLTELERGEVHPQLDALGEKLRCGLIEICDRLGIPVRVTGTASLFYPHFTDREVRNARDAEDADPGRRKLGEFQIRLLDRGIFTLRGHFGGLAAAHTNADVDATLDAMELVLAEMRAERLL